MKASYAFKLGDSYGDPTEVVVEAESFAEAKKAAESLIKGSKVKLGELRRVVDSNLMINHQNIVERKLSIDEHHMKHSGEITEIKVNGGKRK